MPSASPNFRPGLLSRGLSLALALCFTAGLVWYLATHTTLADWQGLWAGLDYRLLAAYLALFLLAVALRGWRYQVLLKASDPVSTPSLGELMLLTLVSNLFVDLLPARSGSLAYVVFLNQKLKVGLAACFSSLAFAFIFDLMAMAPLVALAVWSLPASSGGAGPWLWIMAAILALAGLTALALADRVLAGLCQVAARWLAGPPRAWRRGLTRLVEQAGLVARDMAQVKAQGVFWPVLGLSVVIRAGKYLGLYLLVLGVAGQWGAQVVERLSLALVLFALVAAEASASLPISGLAGFGAYEGVMMLTLQSAGLEPVQAALLPVTLHVITQGIDYSLGSLALLRLSVLKKNQAGPLAQPANPAQD